MFFERVYVLKLTYSSFKPGPISGVCNQGTVGIPSKMSWTYLLLGKCNRIYIMNLQTNLMATNLYKCNSKTAQYLKNNKNNQTNPFSYNHTREQKKVKKCSNLIEVFSILRKVLEICVTFFQLALSTCWAHRRSKVTISARKNLTWEVDSRLSWSGQWRQSMVTTGRDWTSSATASDTGTLVWRSATTFCLPLVCVSEWVLVRDGWQLYNIEIERIIQT